METGAQPSGRVAGSVPARVRATRHQARRLGLKVNKRGDQYWLLEPRAHAFGLLSPSLSLDELEHELARIASERLGGCHGEEVEVTTEVVPPPPTAKLRERRVRILWTAIQRWRGRRLEVQPR
jgi:hypothetical protein